MADTAWLRQTEDKPLFADVLWSRPENKRTAGKLLIIGGNLHSFSAVSQAYTNALEAGAGTLRAILPDSLAKALGKTFPEAEFAPSTPSGSFARSALGQLVDNAAWADGALLAGDFGKNAETTILLESFIQKENKPLVLVGDSIDLLLVNPDLEARDKTILVLDFTQLQKLMSAGGQVIKSTMALTQLVDELCAWSQSRPTGVCTVFSDQIICAHKGRVSLTNSSVDLSKLAAYTAVWQIWQPSKTLEALTTAAYCSL